MDACVMCKRNVQQAENWIKCHLWGRIRDFSLALLWGISADRERATGRERGLGSQPQRLGAKVSKTRILSGRKE
jgi:hypothetical protein